jgi:PAS domain-containing protein
MTSATWSITEDILPLLGFTAAFVVLLLVPVRPGGTFSRSAKVFFAASILCYLLSTAASILAHPELMPTAFDPVVNSIELMWVPFMLFGVYSLYAHQRLVDAVSAQRGVIHASEMLESIVETTPAGIVVLNDAGQITFANGEARRLLDIEDDVSSTLTSPGCTVRVCEDGGAGEPMPDFSELLRPEPLTDALVVVEWPSGWRRRLSVNTALFGGEGGEGGVTGAVAAFVEREPWRTGAPVRAQD